MGIKERLIKLLKVCDNDKQDVMNRFYGIKSNRHKPMIVDRDIIDCVMQRYGDKGHIIFTINRTDMPQVADDNTVREVIKLLKSTGYYYLPFYEGYEDVENEVGDYVPSFVVFNRNYYTDILTQDFENLIELGKNIATDYNLDSFLCKRPDQPPVYLDREGNTINALEGEICIECVNPIHCTLVERMRRGSCEIVLYF